MNKYLFSYQNYIHLLNLIKEQNTLCDYKDIIMSSKGGGDFIILRHDIEFSPKRALKLAIIEAENNISSSFFFQLTNNSYNTLSSKNIDILKQLIHMGHHVGLHFHLNGLTDLNKIKERICFEIELLSHELNFKVDRFSFHRPSNLVLENIIEIPNIINAYAPIFFTYTKNTDKIDPNESIKYIADSRNTWSYIEPWSYPCKEFFSTYNRVQILCHPYTWSEKGYTTLENLKSIIGENRQEFIETMNSETSYVKEYINEL